jgi:SAM-dependent methyltransferase
MARLRASRVTQTCSFVDSPQLYDAIYRFKNYAREAARLRHTIERFVPAASTILDVACGTGEHARFLKDYYAVDGMDINEEYLGAARLKNPSGAYLQADMLDFDLGRTYDVVTCLFSAIGIVRSFERLERAVACMVRHVRPGGALIVEPWFTPDNWCPGAPLILMGEIGAEKVYRMSICAAQEQSSVLLYNYLRCTPRGIEHYSARIELGLFTRDEMTWAFESAGLSVRYDPTGLMGRGLYVGLRSRQSSESAAPCLKAG